MNDLITIGLLIDFYGQLLTARQYEILDLYYNNDYSLGEISEQLEISRQGVHDNIKRAKAALLDFEQKLGLVGKFTRNKSKAQEILDYINDIDIEDLRENNKQNILKIKNAVILIINDD